MSEVKRLSYTDSGTDQPPVILLHGFLGCKEDWDEIAVSFKERHRIIQIDLPGHGTSVGFPDADYSMTASARMVIEVLDLAGVDIAHLVGYSMGARLALYLAANFPDRWDRIVLESGSAGLRSEAERAARRASDEQVALRLRNGTMADFLESWYCQPLFATIQRDKERFATLLKRRMNNDRAELVKSLAGIGTGQQPYLGERLAELPHQILFAAGSEDDKYLELALDMSDQCQDGTVWVCPDAGHAVHFEDPERYSENVGTFLWEGI